MKPRTSLHILGIAVGTALFALTFVLPLLASAQQTTASGFVPLAKFEGSSKLQTAYSSSQGIGQFMNMVFMASLSIGAILAVLRLAWAGFIYMSTDLWGQKGAAKEIIRETLLGLFLLLGIYLILTLINPDIVQLRLEPKNLKLSVPADSSLPAQAPCSSGPCPGSFF